MRSSAKGVKRYHSRFELDGSFWRKKVFLDASPMYIYDPEVAGRIHQYNKSAKLILLLRNPITRAFSGWNMYKMMFDGNHLPRPNDIVVGGAKPRFPTFEERVDEEIDLINKGIFNRKNCVARGMYLEQIQRYLQFFDRSQFLIIESAELKHNQIKVAERISRFLNIKPFSWQVPPSEKSHVRPYSEPISEPVKNKIEAFFKPYNESLFDFLGTRYDW